VLELESFLEILPRLSPEEADPTAPLLGERRNGRRRWQIAQALAQGASLIRGLRCGDRLCRRGGVTFLLLEEMANPFVHLLSEEDIRTLRGRIGELYGFRPFPAFEGLPLLVGELERHGGTLRKLMDVYRTIREADNPADPRQVHSLIHW
jgi:hypothetical protein